MVNESYTAIELSDSSDLKSPPPTFGSDKRLIPGFTVPPRARETFQTSYTAAKKAVVKKKLWRTHLPVFALFFVCGVLPVILFFEYTWSPFTPEDQLCHGGTDDQNDKPAIQGLVTIDGLLFSMPFGAAKLLDTAFDLVIGRGTQLIAALIAYDVFTKAMMRAIEKTPTPYRTFMGLSINGVSLWTVWYLIKDMRRHKTKRSTFLFVWISLSSVYVLALSTFLSAMSGYVSSVKEYLPTDDSQLIPIDQMTRGYIVADASRIGGTNGTCYSGESGISESQSEAYYRTRNCPCPLPNGTVYNPKPFPFGVTTWDDDAISPFTRQDCQYQRLGSNFTYHDLNYIGDLKNSRCSGSLNITVDGRNYSIGYTPLNLTSAYCLRGKGYPYRLQSDTICMPNDGGNYHWGFSRMLTAVFLIIHLVWSVSMYIVWLDAMLFSELVRRGFSLTQLRGAFTVVAAAQDRLDTEADNLITVPTKEVDRYLFDKGSVIDQKYLAKSRDDELFDHVQPHGGT